MKPANGVDRYQNVVVEEAFRRYSINVNMPSGTIEQRWDEQFHIGPYDDICGDEKFGLDKISTIQKKKEKRTGNERKEATFPRNGEKT